MASETPRPLFRVMRTSGATHETPAATTAPANGAMGSSTPSCFRLSRATHAPATAWGISKAGRNLGGKMPILSSSISPSAAMAQPPVLGLRLEAARKAGPRAILNPLIAASVMARSNGVFRFDIVCLLVHFGERVAKRRDLRPRCKIRAGWLPCREMLEGSATDRPRLVGFGRDMTVVPWQADRRQRLTARSRLSP